MIKDDLMTAFVIAEAAHRGQTRKFTGEPYIMHPMAVSDMGCDTHERIVGLLHDVVEDTYVTEGLLRCVFTEAVVDAVMIVTRRDDESYVEFIGRIKNSKNQAAIRVKLNDLRHNTLTLDKKSSMRGRYERAMEVLQS